MNLVESLEKSLQANAKIPQLSPGDTVRVHGIVEGDRERIQVFQGTVIRLRKGGANAQRLACAPHRQQQRRRRAPTC